MSPKSFLILLTVTALSFAGALALVLTAPGGMFVRDSSLAVLPDLQDRENDVARIIVESAGDRFILEQSEAGVWTTPDRGGYAVKGDDARQLVLNLADLRFLEEKTSDPDRLERLGLRDVDQPESQARLVRIEDHDGNSMGEILIGRSRSLGSGPGTYVRLPDDDQAWLAEGGAAIGAAISDWVDRDVVHLPSDTVREAIYTHPDGEVLYAYRPTPEMTDFILLELPEGRVTDQAKANRLGQGFSFVALADVMPLSDLAFPEEAVVVQLTSFDGIEITARVAMIDDAPWAVVSAAVSDNAVDDPARLAEVQAFVDETNARVEGWAYQLLPHVYERLTRRAEDVTTEAGS